MDGTRIAKGSRARKSFQGSVWAGPLVILAGVTMLVLMARGVEPSPSRVPLHPWITAISGLVGIGLGVMITANGMSERRERARRWAAALRGPRTAWGVDYPWDTAVARDDMLQSAEIPLVGGISALILMAPYTMFAFFSPGAPPVGKPIMAAGNLLAALLLGYGVLLLARTYKFGRSSLVFGRFPFFLGSRLEAEFQVAVDVRTFESLTATLRCLEDRRYGLSEGVTQVYEVWKSEQLIPGPTAPVKLTFDLPGDPGLATRLAADEPRYWELEVACVRPGLDFRARFLVPVYAPVKSR